MGLLALPLAQRRASPLSHGTPSPPAPPQLSAGLSPHSSMETALGSTVQQNMQRLPWWVIN